MKASESLVEESYESFYCKSVHLIPIKRELEYSYFHKKSVLKAENSADVPFYEEIKDNIYEDLKTSLSHEIDSYGNSISDQKIILLPLTSSLLQNRNSIHFKEIFLVEK